MLYPTPLFYLLFYSSYLLMRGYTIVELMIVISTIAILSLMGIVGMRGAGEREELAAAGRQLLGDLISTQNKASAGYKKAGFSLEGGAGNSYKIFAYFYDYSSCSGDEGSWEYDCPGGESLCSWCKEEMAEILFTSSQVEIDSPPSFSVYFFRPPNIGKARILEDGTEVDQLEIVLKHSKLPFSKRIIVESPTAVKVYEE